MPFLSTSIFFQAAAAHSIVVFSLPCSACGLRESIANTMCSLSAPPNLINHDKPALCLESGLTWASTGLLTWHHLTFGHRHCYRVDVCIPVYIQGRNPLSLLWSSDLTEIGSPMVSRVNNDVILGPYLS